MKFIKVFIYVLVSLVIIVGVIVGLGVHSVKKAVLSTVAPVAGQSFTIEGNKVVINAALTPEMGITLTDGPGFCTSDEIKALTGSTGIYFPPYNRSSFCLATDCHATITFKSGKTIPDTIDVFQKKDGVCVKNVLKTKENMTTVKYSGDIGITGPLKDYFAKLPGQKGLEKHAKSQYQGSSVISFGDTRVSLSYPSKVAEDWIIYNGQEVQIVYKN